jgi:hypothetical protein
MQTPRELSERAYRTEAGFVVKVVICSRCLGPRILDHQEGPIHRDHRSAKSPKAGALVAALPPQIGDELFCFLLRLTAKNCRGPAFAISSEMATLAHSR